MERTKGVKEFLKQVFFEIDEDISEEEAKQDLIECGIEVEKIEKMKEELLKKLDARKKLRKAKKEREEMMKIIKQLNQNNNDENDDYKLAARSANGEIKADDLDKKILELLKQKCKEN